MSKHCNNGFRAHCRWSLALILAVSEGREAVTERNVNAIPGIGCVYSCLSQSRPILRVCFNDFYPYIFRQPSEEELPSSCGSQVVLGIFSKPCKVRDVLVDHYAFHLNCINGLSGSISPLGVGVFGSELYKELILEGLVICHGDGMGPLQHSHLPVVNHLSWHKGQGHPHPRFERG